MSSAYSILDDFHLKLKRILLLLTLKFYFFQLFAFSLIHVFSTLVNAVKRDAENVNVVSTLSNVNINFKRYYVEWKKLNVVNFNVKPDNVVSMLI